METGFGVIPCPLLLLIKSWKFVFFFSGDLHQIEVQYALS